MTAKHYAMINSADSLVALVNKLQADGKPIGFDVETGYLGPDREKGSLYIDWDAQFVCGFSITNDLSWARYVPVAHDDGINNVEDAWEIVKPLLETLPSTAHNLKFEKRNLRALERKGRGPSINLNGTADSALQSYVLSEYQYHGLKSLVNAVFGHEQAELKTLFPGATEAQLKAMRFNVLDTTNPEVINYACEDAVWTLALDGFFMPKIAANSKRQFIYDLEMKISDLLCDLEDAGHAVDWEELEKHFAYAEPFRQHMIGAARKGMEVLAKDRGVEDADYSNLNFNSAPQMRAAMYGDLGLTTTRTTKKGELSTDATALERLSRDHVAIKKVLEVREVGNLAGRLKKWTNEYSIAHDKRVHASFNQIVVGSGRFSANDPSIQQLPKTWGWHTLLTDQIDFHEPEHVSQLAERAVFGKHYWVGNFRDFLIAADGCYLLSFDYSQIELRALAGLAKEPYLIEAFANGVDIHKATASMMLNVPIDQVTKDQRQIGKTINFGIVFGMGAKLLAESLAIEEWQAQELLDKYLSAFSRVGAWIEDQKMSGTSIGFVETFFGRKVTLWDLQSDNFMIRGKGERLCVNAPVQGTATGDYMKISMLRAKRVLEEKGWWMTKVRMINNLHDALTFEADNDIDPAELRAVLEPAVSWPLEGFPEFTVDWEIGQKWGSSAEWNDEPCEFIDGCWTVITPEETTEEEFDAALEAGDPVEVEVQREDPHVMSGDTEESFPETFLVTLKNMPERERFHRFLAMLADRPGENVMELHTPDGVVLLESYPTSITADDQAEISMIFNGAEVQPKSTIDIDTLGKELGL